MPTQPKIEKEVQIAQSTQPDVPTEYSYAIKTLVPEDAQKVVIFDELEPALLFAGTAARTGTGQGSTPPAPFDCASRSCSTLRHSPCDQPFSLIRILRA